MKITLASATIGNPRQRIKQITLDRCSNFCICSSDSSLANRRTTGWPQYLPSKYPSHAETFSPIQQAIVPPTTPNSRPANVQITLDGTGSKMSTERSPVISSMALEVENCDRSEPSSDSIQGSRYPANKRNGKTGIANNPISSHNVLQVDRDMLLLGFVVSRGSIAVGAALQSGGAVQIWTSPFSLPSRPRLSGCGFSILEFCINS